MATVRINCWEIDGVVLDWDGVVTDLKKMLWIYNRGIAEHFGFPVDRVDAIRLA